MSKERAEGMSLIVKMTARLTVCFMLLYGIYILSHGHLSPGGGFAGGLIVTLAFINIMLAYGKDTALKKLPGIVRVFFDNLGALLLFSVALLSFTMGYFLINLFSKGEPLGWFRIGTIPLNYLAVALKVGAGIFAIFVSFLLLRAGRKMT